METNIMDAIKLITFILLAIQTPFAFLAMRPSNIDDIDEKKKKILLTYFFTLSFFIVLKFI